MSQVGDNIQGSQVRFEIRLFNSLSRSEDRGSGATMMTLPAGSTVADVLNELGISRAKVFLILVNGRDLTRSLYGGVRTDYFVQDGDVVAFSGPVPYSWGYGAPVV